MKALLCALFVTFFALAPQAWATMRACEVSASKPLRVAYATMRVALRKHDISLEEVRSSLAAGGTLDPFAASPREIEDLSYRQVYQKALAQLSETQREELRFLLNELVSAATATEETVAKVRREEAEMITPRVGAPIGVDLGFGHALARTTFEGRPAFLVRFYKDGLKSDVFVDPMNADESRRVRKFHEFTNGFLYRFPIFIEHEGQPLALHMENGMYSNLNTGETKDTLSLGFNKAIFTLDNTHSAVAIHTPNGPRILAGMSNKAKGYGESTLLYNYEKPKSRPQKIADHTCGSMRVHVVGGREFVSCWPDHQTLLVYDVQNGKFLKKVLRSIGHYQDALFEMNGTLFAATMETKNKTFYHIHITNLETGDRRESPALHGDITGPITVVDHDGVPYIYFVPYDGMYRLNPITMTEERMGGSEGSDPTVNTIEWKGRRLLTWNYPKGKYYVMDLDTGSVDAATFSQKFTYTTSFVYGGRAYAMGLVTNSAPYLIHVTSKVDFTP